MFNYGMYPVQISSPWPGRRYVWRLSAALTSAAVLAVSVLATVVFLNPLQQHYFKSYFASTYSMTKKPVTYELLSIYHRGASTIPTDDQIRADGDQFALVAATTERGDQLEWITRSMSPAVYSDLLQRTVYRGSSFLQLFGWSLAVILFLFPLLLAVGAVADPKASGAANLRKKWA